MDIVRAGGLDSTVAYVDSVSGICFNKTPYRTRNKELRKRLHKWDSPTQFATKRSNHLDACQMPI